MIWPLLTTDAVDPSRVKWYLPLAKSLSERFIVVATSPPTSTWAVLPKITPPGLTRNTCPLAVSLPSITEASLCNTRLSATELALGCWKLTCAAEPMLKVCQFNVTCWVAWLICSCAAPGWEIVAWPETTCPPVGSAVGTGPAMAAPVRASCKPKTIG